MTNEKHERMNYMKRLLILLKEFNLMLMISIFIKVINKFIPFILTLLFVIIVGQSIKGNITQESYIYAWLIITPILSIVVSYIDTYISHDISFRIIDKLRNEAYGNLYRCGPGVLENKKFTDMVVSINSDINVFEWFYTHIVIEWLSVILMVAILLFSVGDISILMVIIPTSIILFIIPFLFIKNAQSKGLELKNAGGALQGKIVEGIRGINDIISSCTEDIFCKEVSKYSDNYHKTQRKYSVKSEKQEKYSAWIIRISIIIVILIESYMIRYNINTISKSIFNITVSIYMLYELQSVIDETANYGFIFGAAKRVFTILDLSPKVEDFGLMTCDHIGDDLCLEFEDVVFSYPLNKENKILKKINFKCNKGEIVAIVGPSGSGKTTISKLIQRYYDPDSGNISLNNIDIKKFKISELRKLISVVNQKVYIFNRSIKENIKISNCMADDKKVFQVSKMAQCDDFIRKLEKGYDTVTGENGVKMSGGEKQRISLAQALLKDSPILILDEATSSLDTLLEQKINATINEIKKDKIIIVIAHRQSTIDSADRVIKIEDGFVGDDNEKQEKR